ncbi:homoserine kinase [Myxosarcina sp. GI1]|uniref:homoserine kinase n=1 Tax=Myxosarcina sp. GI1 TaxID=1541065 RepID=UPI00056B574D|nr:homoserine kinase [Myxosarcina sp. GI1]
MNRFTVIVPATTANLGVGFDCLGAALSLYNEFEFTAVNESAKKLEIKVIGDEAARVSTDESNLLYRSFVRLYQHIDKTPPNIEITIKLGVPLARGLGSSATAIVGGLVGANQLAGHPLNKTEIRDLAIAIEGHPDNVVPALLGNCQLAVADGDRWQICSIPWQPDIVPIVAIPNFELSTATARAVLPTAISCKDAIFNISRMGLLIRALATNNPEWLKAALADKLHQPYRQKLITGYEEVRTAAIKAGAYGVIISGAGPTLLALSNSTQVEAVIAVMNAAWSKLGVKAMVRSLDLDSKGAKIF